MKIRNTHYKFKKTVGKRTQKLVMSLCFLLIVGSVTSPHAIAQNLEAGEDPLLPPEVVPLDPSVFAKPVQSQSQSRANEMVPTESGGAPGLSGNSNASISAQEYRKAAFDSLMNQDKAMPFSLPQYSSQKLEMIQTQMENQGNNMGLSPLMTPRFDGSLAQSDSIRSGQMENFAPAYSQTLAGSVRNPVAYRPSRLAGFSHAVSLASLFGLSALSGVYAGRRSPYGYYGLGLMGLGLANYGFRNGFRF